MKQKYVLIASAVGVLIFAVAYAATQLSNAGIKNSGINMITTAVVERAGATIVETDQPSKAPH